MTKPQFTVYRMPTLANPEAFSSVAELRRELHRTNGELMGACAREQTLNDQGQELMQTLYTMLLMYLKGVPELLKYIDAYLDERPKLRERLEEALESASETQVH
jgi:hypothetical protein